MTPGAKIQSTIELLEQVFSAWQLEKRFPADKLLEQHFKNNRYIGSKDRSTIGELFYWALRHKASLEWWLMRKKLPVSARGIVLSAIALRRDFSAAEIEQLPSDGKYSIASLSSDEKTAFHSLAKENIFHPDMPQHVSLNYQPWLNDYLQEAFGNDIEKAMVAMNEQAPTDLRVNTLKTTREKLLSGLQAEGFECSPTQLSPIGIRLSRRAPIFTSKFFKEGHFEVQDEGSQALALLVDASAGQKVIDFCAGAGGKTLAIAASMENKGRILAWDISKKRLDQISQRLRRAGVDNVQVHVLESEHDSFIKRHKASADRVLVDAPCSGSGTWRRNPDLKWRFTQKDLDEVCAVQQEILCSAARLVKVGGKLIYATCSLFNEENDRQVEKFLKSTPNFKVVCTDKIWNKDASFESEGLPSYFKVTPHKDGVDGFFAAVMVRTSA